MRSTQRSHKSSRQRSNKSKLDKRQRKSKKKLVNKHDMTNTLNDDPKASKKAKDLFNAGINALNELGIEQRDKGLLYKKTIRETNAFDSDYGLSGDEHENGDFSGNDSEDSDGQTVRSLQSEVTVNDDDILNLQDREHLVDGEIDDLLDSLMDRDSVVRAQTLNKLNNELRTRRTNEEAFSDKNQRLQRVARNLAHCIRKGSVNEQLHALDTVSLLSLSLQDGLDFLVRYFQSMIKALIQRPQSAVVQMKAMSAWAIICWSFDDSATKIAALKLFEYFWNDREGTNDADHNAQQNRMHFEYADYESDDSAEEDKQNGDDEAHSSQSAKIESAAMSAWLLLITSIGSASDIGSLLSTYWRSLLRRLQRHDATVDNKIGVGKALTVLLSNYHCATEDGDDEWEAMADIEEVESEVLAEFEHLRANTKQHRRREFAAQKAKFRDFVKTLEHRWTPLVVVKLHHRRFEVGGWNLWVQYHAVKGVLKNGLQAHLLQNERVKECFGIEIESGSVRLKQTKSEKKNRKRDNLDKRKVIKQGRGKNRDKKRGFMFDRDVVE